MSMIPQAVSIRLSLHQLGSRVIPTLIRIWFIYGAGALVVLAINYGVRAAVIKALEPAAMRLDRWRQRGLEPERDLGLLLNNFLILAFVAGFVERYQLPAWTFYLLSALWAVHLPRDAANWLHNRKGSPAALHRRGFFLFHFGPLRLRALWFLLSLGGFLFLAWIWAGKLPH